MSTRLRDVRALVTGASGFIGSWTARALHDAGAHVTCVVRTRDSAARLAADGLGHSLVTLDLTDFALLAEAIPAQRPELIFNLAGYGVDRAERDEEQFDLVNARLPLELAKALARAGARSRPRMVHVGSAFEYGATGGILAEDSACAPTTLYGISKLAGTLSLMSRAAGHGVDVTVARLFTVFGPGEHEGRLLPSIINAARTGQLLPLSDGRQRRDFAYVEDVVDAMLKLAAPPPDEGPAVINVASGVMRSVREFVLAAASTVGMPDDQLAFGALPSRPGEMEHDGVAVERLRLMTGSVPSADVMRGVERTRARLATVGRG
ncbi:MAG: NAD-dependent epimerase/dehydratase family protein [Gemmatimonadota bacterium]